MDDEAEEELLGTPDEPSQAQCDWLLGKVAGRHCLCEARFELPVEIYPPIHDEEAAAHGTLQWTRFCPDHALAILLGLNRGDNDEGFGTEFRSLILGQ